MRREKPHLRRSKSHLHSRHSNCLSRRSWMKSSKRNNIATEHLLEVLKPVNTVNRRFIDGPNIQFYRSFNRDQRHHDYVLKKIANMAKHIYAQMCHNTIDPADSIPLLNFQLRFKTTCDRKAVSEGDAMEIFHFFICNPAASIIIALTRLGDSLKKLLKGALYSYCVVVHYLLATYATDDVIADAVNDIKNSI